MKPLLILSALVVLLCCTGCGQRELLSDVDERDSLELLVVLGRAGIAAERERKGRGNKLGFSISVNPGDYQRAIEILHEYGLPRASKESPAELTRQRGFVPNTPAISDLRLDLALASEIEALLTALPSVVDARVVVRSNLRRVERRSTRRAPQASVVIRHISPRGTLAFSPDEVKRIVSNAVPDLAADDVLLTVTRVVLPNQGSLFAASDAEGGAVVPLNRLEPFSFHIDEKDKQRAQKELGSVILVTCFCALVVGLYFGAQMGRRGRGKRRSEGIDESFFLQRPSGRDGEPKPALESAQRASEGQ